MPEYDWNYMYFVLFCIMINIAYEYEKYCDANMPTGLEISVCRWFLIDRNNGHLYINQN
jgi:hypothetical protein